MTTHILTTEQLLKLVKATGGLNDFPQHTDDPKVNYAVDCVVARDMNEEEPEFDEQLYAKDAEPIPNPA